MIDPIRHHVLLAHGSIHDEEALTSLELQARTTAKVNEIIGDVNQQRKQMEDGLASIPDQIGVALVKKEKDGSLAELVNDTLYKNVNDRLGEYAVDMQEAQAEMQRQVDSVNGRVNSIIVKNNPTDGNTEMIDARIHADGRVYPSLGAHIRALATGGAFMDALKPGTIRHGRISAGMLMGDLASRYVIGEQWTTAGRWTGSGYVDPDTLEVVAHSSYQFTEPAPCEYGDTFRVYTAIYGNKIPAAIFYDADKKIIGTSGGGIGQSDWVHRYHYVQVDKAASYISFQCGTGVADFRVLRYSPRMYPDPLEAMGGRGYIRCHAFNRTDTVTDRAQIKMWFPVEEGRSYRFRVEPLIMKNCKGWSVRFFAASSDSAYDRQLAYSDHGRSYAASLAIATDLTIPEHTGEEQPFTHLAVFIDLMANNVNDRIDAIIAPPTLDTISGNSFIINRFEPQNVTLHGSIDGDYVANVPAGGMSSPCWRKRIMIHGDSLTRGNTLPKTSSWFNIACSSRDMEYWNDAENGQAISDMETNVDLYGLDYYVLQGGANDKRLNKPLEGFKAKIRELVSLARAQSPKVKILLMTNWRRTTDKNALGLYDSDYVAAMLEVAEELGVPCFNNYANSLNLLDPNIASWADEGLVSTGAANIHFSVEANKWLAPRFLAELERL